jgi:hypothetical protein
MQTHERHGNRGACRNKKNNPIEFGGFVLLLIVSKLNQQNRVTAQYVF